MSRSAKQVVLVILGVIIAIILLASCDKFLSGSDGYECSKCKHVYTNRSDVKSILRTDMCESCYENFKTIQNMIEGSKKYYK